VRIVLLFGVDHLFGYAAIDRDALTVDEVALCIAQEKAGAGDILGADRKSNV
jgi:hypothetical protein